MSTYLKENRVDFGAHYHNWMWGVHYQKFALKVNMVLVGFFCQDLIVRIRNLSPGD